jgi:CheY-like chemotaxis protein
MPNGGTLTITLERADSDALRDLDDVILCVIDTGTGMSPDVAARAFEPFFTTKERGLGSGLGLATVYGIVRRCGGDVSLTSDLGSGTTVAVRLPGSKLATKSYAPASNFSGTECVLLVDDEVPLRVATARLLRGYGYEVVIACDGLEAMELFERDGESFDIVITDIAMPRMRGDEFAMRLAERRPDLPLIFMSGYRSGSSPLTGRVLQKPVDKGDLLRAIRETLDG